MSERPKPPFFESPHEQTFTKEMVAIMKRDPGAQAILKTAQEAARHIPDLSLVHDELNRCISTHFNGGIAKQLNRTGGSGFLKGTRLALYAGLAASIPEWRTRSVLITPGTDYEYTLDTTDPRVRPDDLTLADGQIRSREVIPKLYLYHAEHALKILGVPQDDWEEFPELSKDRDMLLSPLECTYQIGATPAVATLQFRQGEMLEPAGNLLKYKRSAVIMTIRRRPTPSEAI